MFHHKKIYSNKHLLKKGFFQFMQYFNLTLMKGDSLIELVKEVSKLLLLFIRWVRNFDFFHSFNIDTFSISDPKYMRLK